MKEAGTYDVLIGSWSYSAAATWRGEIGYVAIWEGTAIAAQDVSDLYAEGRFLPAVVPAATLSFANVTPTSVDIGYNSNEDIAGWQLNFSGITGVSVTNSTMNFVTATDTQIVAYDLSGNTLPTGQGTLCTIHFDGIPLGGQFTYTGDQALAGVSGDDIWVEDPEQAGFTIPADITLHLRFNDADDGNGDGAPDDYTLEGGAHTTTDVPDSVSPKH